MAGTIYEPSSGVLARTPILCKVNDGDTPTLFKLQASVWHGSSAAPTGVAFTLFKYPDEGDSAVFDISQLIQGYFKSGNYKAAEGAEFTPSSLQVFWVQCTYTITNATAPDEVIVGTPFSVTNGYSEFKEGVNHTMPLIVSSQSEVYWVNENAPFILAMNQDTDVIGSIQVAYDVGGSQAHINTFTDLTDSGQRLLYADVSPINYTGLYEKSYTVTLLDDLLGELATVTINVECEPRYKPVTVAFINKNGAWENFTFSKRSDESINVEAAEFMPYILETAGDSAPIYNAYTSQIQRYDINARQSLKLNTTFLPEAYYETMKQILMSAQCVWYEEGISINPKTMSLQKKKGVNKQMVQYTIEFDYASQTQNTVR